MICLYTASIRHHRHPASQASGIMGIRHHRHPASQASGITGIRHHGHPVSWASGNDCNDTNNKDHIDNNYDTPMQNYQPTTISIKALAEEDRPREKMQIKGRQALSNAELLAILLHSGNADESALSLAQRILQAVNHNLHELGKQSVEELTRYKGIGPTKAVTIAAALELGRRRQLSDVEEKPQVCNSEDAYKAIAPLLADLAHEEFWILKLNRANRIIGRARVSAGGMSGTVVDSKMVFRSALEGRTASLILCHNHPSGNLQPSQADLDLTRKLTKAGETLDLPVLDHLIIAETGYYSFADEGVLS